MFEFGGLYLEEAKIEEIRHKEEARIREYVSRLAKAVESGKIQKLDFIYPTQILKDSMEHEEFRKLVREFKALGVEETRFYHDYVIFCFGRLYEILDFEDFKTTPRYPDAKAVRNDKKLRIEFETLSSQFDHDQSACDLVICMIHDDKNIPIEVLELKPLLGFLATKIF